MLYSVAIPVLLIGLAVVWVLRIVVWFRIREKHPRLFRRLLLNPFLDEEVAMELDEIAAHGDPTLTILVKALKWSVPLWFLLLAFFALVEFLIR